MSDDVGQWGELREGLHIAGYTFERACDRLNRLLEGDRWKLDGRFKDINQFLDSLRLGNLRAPIELRQRIAHRIKELQPAASNRQIARTLGVGETTVRRDTAPNGAPAPTKANENKASSSASAPSGAPAISGQQAAQMVQRRETGTADKRERRAARERELGQQQRALPDKRYGVIYADPPWRFTPYSEETGMDRAADNHYPTMDIAAIEALTPPAADDAVLFLWATAPMLPEALAVMKAWRFTYKSHFVWVKDKAGTGYWTANMHELLLVGTRGSIPAPAPGEQYESAIGARRGQHSAKPFAFREIIEEMFPTLPRIELFARERFAGWDAWGNEVAA